VSATLTEVRHDRSGGVTDGSGIVTVWLDNPPVNAVDAGIAAAIWDALEAVDDDTRVLVLRGRGERAFSAGADIGGFVSGEGAGDRPGGIQPLANALEQAPVPVVAAIHGYCLGGGLEIALGCDLRVATTDAQLGFPEVNLGLLPGGGGTQRAPRLIAPGRARWLVMSGERIDAPTAADWGLVDFVVDDLDAGIERYAGKLAQQSPHALRAIKALLHETRDARDDDREAAAFAACLASEDGQEGVAAFLEKRDPHWTGR
jgi:enoyl-CoA hydratase/3-hydroxyacyl-CoA dehydrogenase